MNNIYRKSTVIRTYSLIFIEIICVLISFICSLLIRFTEFKGIDYKEMYNNYLVFLLVMVLLYSIVTDWNRDFFARGYLKELWAVFKYDFAITLVSATFIFMTKDSVDFSRQVLIVTGLINYFVTYIAHLLFKEFMFKCYKYGIKNDRLMVVAEAAQVEKIVNKILSEKHWNYVLTYIAVVDKDMVGQEIQGVPIIANGENITEVLTQSAIDRVFISTPHMEHNELKNMIIDFETMGVLCHYNVELDDMELVGKEAGTFAGYSVISFSMQNMDFRRLMVKRAIDILGSLVGLLITGIIFPFVALAIKIESKGPVIFKQERIGKNGRHFKIYKFRSMYPDAEARLHELMDKNEVEGLMFKLEDDPRITKVGKFIRKTSIDELPQFMNVFKGDMSLVGTRPPTLNEFEQYNPHYRRRLCITPGLTGMWQVSGRSDITDFDEVVKLDLEYIDNWSIMLDIKILFKTVAVVLFRKGSR